MLTHHRCTPTHPFIHPFILFFSSFMSTFRCCNTYSQAEIYLQLAVPPPSMICTYQSTSSLQSHDCHTSILHLHHCRQSVHIKLNFRLCPGLNVQSWRQEDRYTLPTSRSPSYNVSVHFLSFMKDAICRQLSQLRTTSRRQPKEKN